MKATLILKSVQDAPNYRPAGEDGKTCATCVHFQSKAPGAKTGKCDKFYFQARQDFTCDAWSKE